jgi:DNA/RNA endonuclease YhcR with UshA esterase domain
VGREGTVVTITGIAKSYNNKPHYYLNNEEEVVYPENLFVGKVG